MESVVQASAAPQPETERETARKDLRLELRVKNNILWRAIHDRYSSVKDFCRRHPGISYATLCQLLRFQYSPFTKNGQYRGIVHRLEEVLGKPAAVLLPMELYAQMLELGSRKTLEVSSFTALPGAVRQEILTLPAPVEESPEAQAIGRELKEKIEEVLRKLTYRDREILKLHFGLGDGREMTFEEIAEIFQVSNQRVRQILAKTVRKLQGPYFFRPLMDFV